jgi:hypothetical protein
MYLSLIVGQSLWLEIAKDAEHLRRADLDA